eukprot:1160609-Pelagomonas_calceolata.AAC.6
MFIVASSPTATGTEQVILANHCCTSIRAPAHKTAEDASTQDRDPRALARETACWACIPGKRA